MEEVNDENAFRHDLVSGRPPIVGVRLKDWADVQPSRQRSDAGVDIAV
jgi:hypothetical protein